MNNHFRYIIYNLNIASELELPELMPAIIENNPDVNIKFGPVPERLSGDIVVNKTQAQIAHNQFLFKADDIGTYYVTDGNQIIIDADIKADLSSIRLFLFGSVMAALLYQRNCFLLHASAVQKNGVGFVFVGKSGYGKSTTAAVLVERGYKLVSDDLCMMLIDHNASVVLWASYPGMKLWHDSIDYLDWDRNSINEKKNIRPVRAGIEKYRVDVVEDDRYQPGSFKLGGIYFLSKNGRKCVLKNLSGIDAVDHLLKGSYRSGQLEGLGGREQHFQTCCRIAKKLKIKKAIRPNARHNINHFVDMIQQDIERAILDYE